MTIRTGRPPRLPKAAQSDPRLDRAQNIAMGQEEPAQRHRLNTGMMKDGTEPMEAPLPLQGLPFAEFPAAADWEGSHLYDTTNNVSRYSDGTNWIIPVNTATTQSFTGDVTGSGSLGSSIALTIANDAVTFAKMAEMNTQRLIGRNSGSTGNPEEVTVEQALNWISGSANGDLMTRASGNWTRLAIGTAGQQLTVNSGATAPEWATPAVVTLTGTGTGAIANGTTNVDITLPSGYSMIEIEVSALQPVTPAVDLRMRFSQSGSFLSGASDYAFGVTGAADESQDYISTVTTFGENTNEYSVWQCRLWRTGSGSVPKQLHWILGVRTATPSTGFLGGYGLLLANQNAIDGLRLYWSSGNWATGFVTMRGYA